MALGQAYSNNGLSFRTSPGGADLQAGEVFFATPPSPSQLEAAFPGYNAAIAAQGAATAANAQYAAALSSGVTITWTNSTALNGTYAVDPTTQFNITAETVSILTNGVLTNGQTTRNWPTMAGTFVNFTVPQFKAFATAIALYIDQVQSAFAAEELGQGPTWPSSSITINL